MITIFGNLERDLVQSIFCTAAGNKKNRHSPNMVDLNTLTDGDNLKNEIEKDFQRLQNAVETWSRKQPAENSRESQIGASSTDRSKLENVSMTGSFIRWQR